MQITLFLSFQFTLLPVLAVYVCEKSNYIHNNLLEYIFLVDKRAIVGYDFTALYCYQCVSTHPGCGTPFNWLWYWSKPCPEVNDKCVKIIERKGASEVITRDCLSSLRSIRRDLPADHHEGCRPAAKNVRLAHYVNNSITELDIRQEYYDSTEWCFCFFDNRCNKGIRGHTVLLPVLFLSAILTIYL